MDNRTLSIVPTNDFTPGIEGSVHIALSGENVVLYVEEELAAELVRRYNNFPTLVEALKHMSEHWPAQKPDSPAFLAYAKARQALEAAKAP
jgi:hypothetical protein